LPTNAWPEPAPSIAPTQGKDEVGDSQPATEEDVGSAAADLLPAVAAVEAQYTAAVAALEQRLRLMEAELLTLKVR